MCTGISMPLTTLRTVRNVTCIGKNVRMWTRMAACIAVRERCGLGFNHETGFGHLLCTCIWSVRKSNSPGLLLCYWDLSILSNCDNWKLNSHWFTGLIPWTLGGVVALLVGRWTCDLQVAGLSSAMAPLPSGLGQATYNCVTLSPSSITWYQSKGGCLWLGSTDKTMVRVWVAGETVWSPCYTWHGPCLTSRCCPVRQLFCLSGLTWLN